MYKIVLNELKEKYNIKPIETAYYQIAVDESFSKDKTILTLVKRDDFFTLDIELDFEYSNKYYIRGKYVYIDGDESDWSTPVMITKNSLKILYEDILIKPPVIEIDGTLEQLKYGGFTINVKGFRVENGTAKHVATDYLIKDFANRIIWSDINDNKNLYSVKVPEGIIQGIDPYHIYVRFVADRGYSAWRKVTVSLKGLEIPNDITCEEKLKYYDKYINRLLQELALTEICKNIDYGR